MPSTEKASSEITWTSKSPVGGPLLFPQLAEALEQPGQVGRIAAAVEPAVGAGGPPEGGRGMAAHQDRERLGRGRADLDRRQVVDLAVVLEVPAGREAPHDVDGLVHPAAPALPGHTDRTRSPRARGWCPTPRASRLPVMHGHRGGLLGHQQGMAHRAA